MALSAVISSKIPMVIVLGATGTGKTKLGLELAQKFATEIISADSMQIYKGLDVVTAKATVKEREMVKHHLVDILEPHQMFTVVDFRNRTLKIIENLTAQGKIPIIVGGTNYYLESIVYKILVEEMSDSEALLWDKTKRKRDSDDDYESEAKRSAKSNETSNKEEDSSVPASKNVVNTDVTISKELKEVEASSSENDASPESKTEITSITKEQLKEDVDNEKIFTNEEIHARLKAVDPAMASRLHPNNRRKVLRSIELWLKTGRRHSEVLDEQKLSEGHLRRPGATIILWLKCEQNVHDERLNARVDAMLQEGLIAELLDFHDRHNRQRIRDGTPPDYTKGVFQTLGFKEFHDYLMLSEDERNTESGKKLLEQSIENMKMATRRYARRQNKMVSGRFLEFPRREVPPIFELDTTELSKWDEEVKNKAIQIIESFLNNSPCPFEPLKPQLHEEKNKINSHSSNYCEVCKRLIIGDKEFEIHMKSNRHLKVLKKKNKLAVLLEKKVTEMESEHIEKEKL